jgi:hypothetical protein
MRHGKEKIMKRILVLITLLLFSGHLYSQTIWFCRDIINHELEFLTPIDSFKNIIPIINGKVAINNDTINLRSIDKYYYDLCYDKDKVKSYYLSLGVRNDSLLVILRFTYDRLFEISISAKGSYYLNNIKFDLFRLFKLKKDISYNMSSDSVVNYGNRIVTYGEKRTSMVLYGINKNAYISYYEDFATSQGQIVLRDKKTSELMPSLCGICNDGRTWEKLKKYIIK